MSDLWCDFVPQRNAIAILRTPVLWAFSHELNCARVSGAHDSSGSGEVAEHRAIDRKRAM